MSNREIANHLGVDEASVRRALGKKKSAGKEKRFLVTVTEL